MDITGKIKANRTRPAEIEGEEVFVKVYSLSLFKKTFETFKGDDDKAIAANICDQFQDKDGKPVFTPEFILSDDCPQCFVTELVQLFVDVNTGTYAKKKAMTPRPA